MRIDSVRFTWRRLDDAVVVLDLDQAEYFSLAGVAGELWERLAAGDDEAALIEYVGTTYDIDQETAAADVRDLIAGLQARSAVLAD